MTRATTMAEIVADIAAESHAEAYACAVSAAHRCTSDGGADESIEFNDHSVALFTAGRLYSISLQLDFDNGRMVAPLHDQVMMRAAQ